jgi:hypothetical protein
MKAVQAINLAQAIYNTAQEKNANLALVAGIATLKK